MAKERARRQALREEKNKPVDVPIVVPQPKRIPKFFELGYAEVAEVAEAYRPHTLDHADHLLLRLFNGQARTQTSSRHIGPDSAG